MLTRHGQLFFRHVDTGHMAFRPDKARQCIDVTPGAAAEIEHPQAAKLGRNGQAAPVITRRDRVMHPAQRRAHMQGRRRIRRTRIGAQV